MKKQQAIKSKSCTDCGVYNCRNLDATFPAFCLTTQSRGEHGMDEMISGVTDYLRGEHQDALVARVSAQIEGRFYGKLTRVEEIVEFAKGIGAKKIGIATCAGLIQEAKIFAAILSAKGLESYSAICKVGAVDKTEIGLAEQDKLRPGKHEAMCNPILQAQLLNQQETDLNVVIGLCVGHDSLFLKHSEALVTTLVVKDRVMAHNPVGALYNAQSYYKRLLQES
ncbi:DUF1847 domain-containing protein [Azotosporobacter soli]|uniref:DUF1847 domain-containing protein n=1 Tax=Azotosporobacter soli TaxID=3055040 RepID=UPI0031FF12AE